MRRRPGPSASEVKRNRRWWQLDLASVGCAAGASVLFHHRSYLAAGVALLSAAMFLAARLGRGLVAVRRGAAAAAPVRDAFREDRGARAQVRFVAIMLGAVGVPMAGLAAFAALSSGSYTGLGLVIAVCVEGGIALFGDLFITSAIYAWLLRRRGLTSGIGGVLALNAVAFLRWLLAFYQLDIRAVLIGGAFGGYLIALVLFAVSADGRFERVEKGLPPRERSPKLGARGRTSRILHAAARDSLVVLFLLLGAAIAVEYGIGAVASSYTQLRSSPDCNGVLMRRDEICDLWSGRGQALRSLTYSQMAHRQTGAAAAPAAVGALALLVAAAVVIWLGKEYLASRRRAKG